MSIRFSMSGKLLCSGTSTDASGLEQACTRGIPATLIVLADRDAPLPGLFGLRHHAGALVEQCVPVAAGLPDGWVRLERPHTVSVFCPDHAHQARTLAQSLGLEWAEQELRAAEDHALRFRGVGPRRPDGEPR